MQGAHKNCHKIHAVTFVWKRFLHIIGKRKIYDFRRKFGGLL